MPFEYKVKILKDTPFNKAEDILNMTTFRLFYGYICPRDAADAHLVTYLQNHITYAEWFQLIPERDEEPLAVYIDGVLYTKEFSGMYQCWENWHHHLLGKRTVAAGHKLGTRVYSIAEVRTLIRNALFSQTIPHYYSDVNAKL